MCSNLKDTGVEFFTHDIHGDKPFKAVIRGLDNTDPKRIQAELRNRYKMDATAVYRMSRHDELTKMYGSPLSGAFSLNALQAVRTIGNIIVS